MATASVKGGLFETAGLSSLTQISGKGFWRRKARQALGRKQALAMREVMETLDGVAPGSAAAKNYTRVIASDELGGARAIETQALVNRNTNANDVTEINADLLAFSTKTTHGNSPPANLDGNPLGTR